MAKWDSLIRFAASEGGEYWASLPIDTVPAAGLTVQGFPDIDALESGSTEGTKVTVDRLLAPVPDTTIPIMCIGLNYRNHANEASV
jgi:2-keto-4-pentenoate hydratase/2-oxohepta-3-ene-1,7-dioic acid hydratase in catechol pathway